MAEKWKDQIHGGLADKDVPSEFDPKQLKAGIEVEMEHTDDPKKAAEIAMDHLIEDPLYYQKLKQVEENMKAPKLTEVFRVREAVEEEDQVDVHAKNVHIDLEPHEHEDVYEAFPPKPSPSQVKAAQKKHADRMKRIHKKAGPQKTPQQQSLPGMDKVFSTKPPPKPGSWPDQQDDRMPLDQAKGKYLHIPQSSAVSPYWLQQTGHTYKSIPSDMMKGLKVDTNPGASWGSGTYKIGDDGTLTLAASDWDSSD